MTKQEINRYTKYSSKLSRKEMREIVTVWVSCLLFGVMMGAAAIGLILTQGI